MNASRRGQQRLLSLVITLALLLTALPPGPPAAQAAGDLFFSEYIEGSSNNKALEIYNGTGAAVDLAAGGYSVQMFFNGSASAGLTINLTGTVAKGDVFVLAQAFANPFVETVGMVSPVPHPAQPEFKMLSNPLRIDGVRPAQTVCSALGADNERLLGTPRAKTAAE